MIIKIIKNLFLILLFINLSTCFSFSKTNTSILKKINNEIITSIDLENEKQFLLFLNPNMKNLSNSQIEKISENSLVNRKIKEIELMKYFDIDKDNFGEVYSENFIANSNFQNKELFLSKLDEYNLNYKYFIRNIGIDNLWKEFIFNKFKTKIKIDTDSLIKQIQNQKNEIEELNLSEILFNSQSNISIEEISKKIYQEIDKSGFEAAASIFSISESKNLGGKIGWVKSNQISQNIYSIIKNEMTITKPIKTKSGYLILKINDRRKINEKINLEEELKKLVNIETNNELNKLGFIYFNKIKKRTFISEN
tara:strand:+ start:81 stop:1007 length:927 start_codon:yes stop_codon:yes gene_type:complete